MEQKIKQFRDGVLRHIANVISNSYSHQKISDITASIGFRDPENDDNPKFNRIYNQIRTLNAKRGGQFFVARIIEAFADPAQWINNEQIYLEFVENLNQGLFHDKLQINLEGHVFAAEERFTIPKELIKVSEQNLLTNEIVVRPIFKNRDIAQDDTLCFVLMPFRPPFEELYTEVIQPTVTKLGLQCVKANNLFTPTSIPEDIWTHICRSKVIIADVSGQNPNVFYELGIAHTVGKPVITITQDKKDVSFDIAQYRCIHYNDDSPGHIKLANELLASLKSINP